MRRDRINLSARSKALLVMCSATVLSETGAVAADATEKSNGEAVSAAVAVILDDAVPRDRREDLIARHKKDSAALLRRLTEGLTPGTPEELRRIPWIWRVAVAAGRRNDLDELAAVLDTSLPEPDGPLLEWQAVAVGGGVVNGIGLAGAWPSERVERLGVGDRPGPPNGEL